jgi:hypothetical protein
MNIKVEKLIPYLCKHGSCLAKADYEFTDIEDGDSVEIEGIVDKIERKTVRTRVLGHACFNHVEEVNKMLKEIYYGDKKSDSNKQ